MILHQIGKFSENTFCQLVLSVNLVSYAICLLLLLYGLLYDTKVKQVIVRRALSL